MRPLAIGRKILQPDSATGPTRQAQDTSIHFIPKPSVLRLDSEVPSGDPGDPGTVASTMEVQGGKQLFGQEVGAKLKRRVQGLRRSEFDPLQLCVCNCTRSPSGSATSVPPYKCTRFKDYLGFTIAIASFGLRSLRTFFQVYRF